MDQEWGDEAGAARGLVVWKGLSEGTAGFYTWCIALTPARDVIVTGEVKTIWTMPSHPEHSYQYVSPVSSSSFPSVKISFPYRNLAYFLFISQCSHILDTL